MPPLPVITDTYRCVFEWDDDATQHAINVIHVRGTTGGAPGAFTALDGAVNASMWQGSPSNCGIRQVTIQALDGISAAIPFDTLLPAKWKGTGSAEYIPQVSVLIKSTTLRRGRSFRGRTFLPFTGENVQVNGTLQGTFAANITDGWGTFLGDMNTAGWEPVIASYKLAVATGIDSYECENETATQRDRQERNR